MTRHRNAGSSLLEVLVALAIMALIAYLAAPLLSTSGRALVLSSKVAEEVDIAVARAELSRWLSAAVRQSEPDTGTTFVGGSNELRFEMILDDGTFWPGQAARVTLAVENGGARIVATAEGVAEDLSPVRRETILSFGEGSLALEYFGRTDEGADPDWRPEWTEPALPVVVRITIADERSLYPPLAVRPGGIHSQNEMSLSSLVPPATPSRP